MKKFLEKLLEEIPKYMGHFVQCLIHPTKFLQEQFATVNNRELVEKSLKFFILSALIVFLLSGFFPTLTTLLITIAKDASKVLESAKLLEDNNRSIQLAVNAVNIVSATFELLALATITYLAWRLAGVHSNFQHCFGFVTFLMSIIVVTSIFIQAIPNVAQVDPVVGKGFVELAKNMESFNPPLEFILCDVDSKTGNISSGVNGSIEFNSAKVAIQKSQETWLIISERPLYKIAEGLHVVARVALLIWITRFWFAYGKLQGASSFRSIVAVAVTVIGFLFIFSITNLVVISAYTMVICH